MIANYIRVSTLEQAQEGYSISAQKERLTAYCKAQGWENYKFYVDEGISAKDTDRPELQRLLKDMRNGRIDTILVYRLDRFTRKVIDFHKMLEEMKEYDCTFKSATEPYDTSSAMGRMFISLVATIAQWEAENLSERIKMALEEKVSSGERVGNVPYPFDLGDNEKLIINPGRTKTTMDIIEKIKSGMSAESVSDYLNKTNNDRIWRAQTVLRVLRNPALYGATRWNETIYENTHEGIISKQEYDKLQKILSDRAAHRRREVKSTYIFQGVVACPSCGRPLSVNRYIRKRADGSEYQFAMYRCQPCGKSRDFGKHIMENKILDALYDYMENLQITDIEQPEQKEESMYAEQLRQVERKREKYQRAWASDLMSDDEFKRLMDETKSTYDDLKEKAKQTEAAVPIDAESLKQIVFTFNDNFRKLTAEEKKGFVAAFIRKIEIEIVPQLPVAPRKSNKGNYAIKVTNVDFY